MKRHSLGRSLSVTRLLSVGAVASAVLAPLSSGQNTLYRFAGDGAAMVGDVNRDGYADFMLGAVQPGAGVAWVYSGVNGAVLHTFQGSTQGEFFGYSFGAAGDVDRDGWPDLAVASRVQVQLRSGRTGAVLRQLPAPLNSSPTVIGIGDVDGDGFPELAIGDPPHSQVLVYSGRTALVLYQVTGNSPSDNFGFRLAAPGDLDGDGAPDLLVSATGSLIAAGYVRTISGRTGATLATMTGTTPFVALRNAAVVGDVDGDQVPDIALQEAGSLAASLYSGRTGALLRTIPNPFVLSWPTAVAAAGDVDGDGNADVAVGFLLTPSQPPTALVVFSGRTGAVLRTLEGSLQDPFNGTLAGGADLDGDGRFDLIAVDAPTGRVRVFSIETLTLSVDRHLVSLTAPLTQGFTLAAGPSQAGQLYILVGSATGRRPGINLFGLHLPLNFDPYHQLIASNANSGPFVRTLGILDATGGASAGLVVTQSFPPELVGVTLDHAYWVIDPTLASFRMASNAVPLTFTP